MLKQSIIAATLMASLTGCGGTSLSKNQRAEVENIAEDFADGAEPSGNLEARVAELERQMKASREAHSSHFKTDEYLLEAEKRLSKENLKDANSAAELERRINELRR
jgi:hypothetical protein